MAYVSDELTHFVGRHILNLNDRFNIFAHIVEQGWLQASYREQFGPGFAMLSDSRKHLSSNEKLISKTLCFCDIPEKELGIHITKYGPFGIAFPKAVLLQQGASPVFYVARNASTSNLEPGIGPRTLGDRFDQLHSEMDMVCAAFERYVWAREPDNPAGLRATFKLSPPDTPEGQQALGKLHALHSDLDKLVFSYLKFFTAQLPHEDADNYYMEREWRKRDGFAFSIEQVAGVYMPHRFREQFLVKHPEYENKIRSIE